MQPAITPSNQACGATVTGLDLGRPLADDTVATLRAAWLAHRVLAFPDQVMNDDDLERFTRYFGPFGEDPFIGPIAGRKHVIAVSRRAGDRSMAIRPSREALATQVHPLVRRHPETGEEGLYGCLGYIIGYEGHDRLLHRTTIDAR